MVVDSDGTTSSVSIPYLQGIDDLKAFPGHLQAVCLVAVHLFIRLDFSVLLHLFDNALLYFFLLRHILRHSISRWRQWLRELCSLPSADAGCSQWPRP